MGLTLRGSLLDARLKELEVREEMLKLVADLVGLDQVRSQLRMISLRREFLQERERARAARGTPTFVPHWYQSRLTLRVRGVRDTKDLGRPGD